MLLLFLLVALYFALDLAPFFSFFFPFYFLLFFSCSCFFFPIITPVSPTFGHLPTYGLRLHYKPGERILNSNVSQLERVFSWECTTIINVFFFDPAGRG